MKPFSKYTDLEVKDTLLANNIEDIPGVSTKENIQRLINHDSINEIIRIEAVDFRTVDSTRFGVIQDKAHYFPDGVLGFEEYKRWILKDVEDSTNILWLQAVDNGRIALPLYSLDLFFQGTEKEGEFPNQYGVLTIPVRITNMTINLKATITISKHNCAQLISSIGEVNTPAYAKIKKTCINS